MSPPGRPKGAGRRAEHEGTPDSPQIVTRALRRWLVEQARGGQSDQALLAAMLASGWRRAVALGAIGEVLARAAPRTPMPQPALAEAGHTVRAGDREVQILSAMVQPRVIVFAGLLAPHECDELVALAAGRLAASETVAPASGAGEINAARTSQGMFFERAEHPLVGRIEARIAALLQWPVERGEGLQVLRYGPGAQYQPHYDFFDPAQPGTAAIVGRGGQRVASLVMYLNTPLRGGATTFPDVGLEVMPVRGNAVFFSYARPHPDTLTLHGSAPVQAGEKWVATKWLREGRFD